MNLYQWQIAFIELQFKGEKYLVNLLIFYTYPFGYAYPFGNRCYLRYDDIAGRCQFH